MRQKSIPLTYKCITTHCPGLIVTSIKRLWVKVDVGSQTSPLSTMLLSDKLSVSANNMACEKYAIRFTYFLLLETKRPFWPTIHIP